MNCNIELLYKTLKANAENSLKLGMDVAFSYEYRKYLLDEATILERVISLIDNDKFLKELAKAYEVL